MLTAAVFMLNEVMLAAGFLFDKGAVYHFLLWAADGFLSDFFLLDGLSLEALLNEKTLLYLTQHDGFPVLDRRSSFDFKENGLIKYLLCVLFVIVWVLVIRITQVIEDVIEIVAVSVYEVLSLQKLCRVFLIFKNEAAWTEN